MDFWIDWLKGSNSDKFLPFNKQETKEKENRKPLGVKIITIFMILAGLSMLLFALYTIVNGDKIEELYPELKFLWIFDFSKEIAIASYSINGLFSLVVAYWLHKGIKIAWLAAFGTTVFGLIIGILDAIFPPNVTSEIASTPVPDSPFGNIIAFGVYITILVFLMRSNVLDYFKESSKKSKQVIDS